MGIRVGAPRVVGASRRCYYTPQSHTHEARQMHDSPSTSDQRDPDIVPHAPTRPATPELGGDGVLTCSSWLHRRLTTLEFEPAL